MRSKINKVVNTHSNIRGEKLRSGDFMLVVLTTILVIFGIIMVFSASYYSSISRMGSPYYYLKRDLVFAFLGTVLMLAVALFDYRKLKIFAFPFLVVSFILLVLLFVPGVGLTQNGATRWIGVGGFTLMPGEISKIALIIFVSAYLSADPKRIYSAKKGVFPMLALGGGFAFLIAKQPNLSTAITAFLIVVVIMFVAGMNPKWLLFLSGIGVAGFSLIMLSGNTYWRERIISFTDPFKDSLGDGFQVVQSLLALGSGGLFGVGPGNSVQKNLYLPEPQNDFILAIVGEELGYIGIILLLLVYILLIWRGMKIAINAPDQFGMLLAAGITAMIGIQVVLNVAIVTSSMPPTGIILPFVSYGGNALMIFMGSIGVLLNISRHSTKQEV